MVRKVSWIVRRALPALAVVAGAACGGEKPAEAPPVAATRAPVAVTVAPVVASELQENIDVVGSLTPKFSTEIKSEVTGTVSAVYVTEWVPVRKGQRLAQLDTSETEATIEALKAAVAQAAVTETRAKREFDRAKELKDFGLITPQQFDDARSAVEAAQAAVTAANAQVKTAQSRLAKGLMVSPMDGVVAFRGISVGDRLENMGGGDPAFRIVDNRQLDLTVTVPSSRLSRVHIGQRLEFTTDAVPGQTFTGKVAFINPSIDAASRSAKVIAEVANPSGQLRGGSFVKGRILVATRPGVLQIVREALLNWDVEQGTADVFVVKADVAEKRQVKLGAVGAVAVEVLSGVAAGDQVVTRGALTLGQGDKVSVAKGSGD